MSRRGFVVLAVFLGAGAVAAAYAVGFDRIPAMLHAALESPRKQEVARSPKPPPAPRSRAELVSREDGSLRLPEDVARTLGIATAPAEVPRTPRSLHLSGSLALDTNRLAHVHTRFVGEVVELGTVVEPSEGTFGGRALARPLRFGDVVEKGQLLAVLWSSDLGEKKSEYIDALSRVRMEQETLARQEALFKDEATPERNLREARRAVEAARIAVARAERTLRSWRLSEADIAAVRAEAGAIQAKNARRDPEREAAWARVELHAPLAGTILEVNLAVGDIVSTDLDLFKIADMETLRVWAHVYEEDLPTLLRLPRPIRWTLRLKSDPSAEPIAGLVEKVGDLIDPNQHTALVVGQVENPGGRMRAGQFITAEVALPTEPGDLEVPISALVEDGQESIVFVQPDPAQPVFALRRVSVSRRAGATASLHLATAGGQPLRAGDRVVTSGAVELWAALASLLEGAKSGESE